MLPVRRPAAAAAASFLPPRSFEAGRSGDATVTANQIRSLEVMYQSRSYRPAVWKNKPGFSARPASRRAGHNWLRNTKFREIDVSATVFNGINRPAREMKAHLPALLLIFLPAPL